MKQFLRRYLPDSHRLRTHKHLQFLGACLHDPQLWHFNRRSTVKGLAVGAFYAFVPVPWQSLLAAITAAWLRFNLPVAVAMVWISNPLTIPPIMVINYRFGAWLLGKPPRDWTFEPSLDWLLSQAGDLGLPLLAGSMAVAVLAGIGTFAVAHLIWRWRIVRRFRRRRRNAVAPS
ncbi:MAG: DUF2062 domain-containing protein [Candidatus Competibacteraceae bacterium]|nr:DUF2062 domain-containing protein [Candidatus Competibacteraceae bacterium]